jgi:hypothetical protein
MCSAVPINRAVARSQWQDLLIMIRLSSATKQTACEWAMGWIVCLG